MDQWNCVLERRLALCQPTFCYCAYNVGTTFLPTYVLQHDREGVPRPHYNVTDIHYDIIIQYRMLLSSLIE